MQLDEQAILWPRGEAMAGRPLLLLLHGLFGSELDVVPIVAALPAEWTVACLRAPIPADPGFAWLQPDPPLELIAQQADASVDAVVDWVGRLPRPSVVGIVGFSQGGAIAVHSLRRAPGTFDFAVSLAGFLVGSGPPDEYERDERPPLFIGHGLADDVIPMPWHRALESWAQERTDLDAHVYPTLGHAVSEAQLADVGEFLRARLA